MKNLIKKIVPSFLLKIYHYKLALVGAFLYGFPSRRRRKGKKMIIIGVTGTSGKSTVVELAARILEEAGHKTASLSSVKFKIGEKEWPNNLKMTMPGRFKIQKFLKKAFKSGCQYVVLEVTSEGIKQYRHKFIDFDIAVFTNLSPEHIESHKGFENYRKAKLELFKKTKNIHIINLDDRNAEYFLKCPAVQKFGFKIDQDPISYRDRISIIEASNCRETTDGILFSVKNIDFNLNLLGRFNIYNALAAICIASSQDISLEVCKKALEKIKGIPGRMEVVIEKPFKVIVDYAHTPDSLKKLYEAIEGPKICVLGACGGGRDKWKRPVLGKIAAQYCKEAIITNEDPYDEEPMEIIEQVAKGAEGRAKKILDRRKAIREALKSSEPDDIVVITGKGCEPWICAEKGKKIPWDDREVAREEMEKILD